MAAPYTSECPLRFAVVGDSWVTEVDVLPDGRRQPKSLSANALKDVLQQRMGHVDFTVAGFPGLTTWAMHDICTSCTLRHAATLSASCYSVGRYPAASQCELEGLPVIQDPCSVIEDIDVAVILVGSNDLLNAGPYIDQWSQEILWNLKTVRATLRERGIEVLICSLYLSEEQKHDDPYREVVRKKMNRKLKRHGEVIDLDSLFGKYDPALWRDGYHLNDMGCDHFGKLLGHYLVRRFGQFPTAHVNGKDMLQVHCDGAHFMPRLLAGSYEPIGKMLRGKEVYKKFGGPGSQDVFIFYCDSRWGRKWRGWYIGPDVHLRRSSWAFHPGPSLGIDGWWTHGRGLPRWASTRVRVTRKRRQVKCKRIVLSKSYWEQKALRRVNAG